jgi:hypothetical protein
MLTVAGTTKDILGANAVAAKVRAQLCNFGNYAPRISGIGILARTAPLDLTTDASGAFTTSLYGNDVISPGGTYYTFTFLDDRKNVVMCNAYLFTDGVNVPDLSVKIPYDPSTVVLPPSPVVSGNYVTLGYASPLAIDGSLGDTYELTLTGNVLSSTMTNVIAGRLYTFIIIEDGVGGRTFAWPGNVITPDAIDTSIGRINIQTFRARNNGNLYPIGGMVYC